MCQVRPASVLPIGLPSSRMFERIARASWPGTGNSRGSVGTGVPIVMHGGSGLTVDEYQECIRNGVRKINYYTYAAKAAYDAVLPLIDDPNVILFSNLAVAARAGVDANVAEFVEILSATANS